MGPTLSMKASLSLLVSVFGFSFGSGTVWAEDPSAPPAEAQKGRALSPALSEALSAKLPHYAPPPSEPAKTETDDADRPRNTIIRLPRFVVQGDRLPVFTEKSISTKQGLAELASRRYLSEFDRGVLNKYTLPLFGTSAGERATARYYEEERLQQQAEANEHLYVLKQADPEDAQNWQDDVNRTFLRSSDMTPTSFSR